MGMSTAAVASVMVVVVLGAFATVYLLVSPVVNNVNQGPTQPGAGQTPSSPSACSDPGTLRTQTISGLDNEYNPGTSVGAISIMYRQKGASAWILGTTGAFSGVPGAEYEVALGLNTTTAQTALAQPTVGPVISYTVPCDASYIKEVVFTNDALSTDLSANAYDPVTGLIVNNGAQPIDIDAGGPVSVPVDWYSSYEENYGTLACGQFSNVMVVRVNTTEYEGVNVQYYGQDLATASAPKSLPTWSGYSDYAFYAPVLESTMDQSKKAFSIILDPDNTVNPTGGASNVTAWLYDSAVFYNSNAASGSSLIQCGIQDETNAEIGAATADFVALNITTD